MEARRTGSRRARSHPVAVSLPHSPHANDRKVDEPVGRDSEEGGKADELDLGAEAKSFVHARLSAGSAHDEFDAEFDRALQLAKAPDVVPSPRQRQLDRRHAESRRAREERQILHEMRLESSLSSSPGSHRSASPTSGSPRFDYDAVARKGTTEALKQVQQFVLAQADHTQAAVIAQLEQSTRSSLGAPLGALAEAEEYDFSDEEDSGAGAAESSAERTLAAESIEELARRVEERIWAGVESNRHA